MMEYEVHIVDGLQLDDPQGGANAQQPFEFTLSITPSEAELIDAVALLQALLEEYRDA